MARCFIVLGMPRTGTSLTTGILNNMGVYVGESRKGKNNPCYYENKALFDFINRVPGVSAGQVVSSIEREAQGKDYGMKHPSIVERWHEFKPHIPEPVFIVTHRRDADAQYNSHRSAINRQHRPEFNERNRVYYQKVLEAINGYPSFNVFYEDWLKDFTQLQKMADFFNLTVTPEARKLADPKLKHF